MSLNKNIIDIRFQDKFYYGRYLNFSFGKRLVSVMSLQDSLLLNYDYVSSEARSVDEQIFYFVLDSEIGNDQEDLVKQIESSL